MADASSVTFDVLLGGKVTPELLKSFKALEDMMQKQGATAKTINAVMSRAYKETFDGIEHESHSAFHHVIKDAQEAGKKVGEAFEKMHKQYEKFAEVVKKPLEYLGITGAVSGALGTFLGARAGEKLIEEGLKVRAARETQEATLRATVGGARAPEYAEAAEKLAAQARVGHEEAMKLITRLSKAGARGPEETLRLATALTGLGGGTAEGAEAARKAYAKASMMMMGGRVRPTAIGAIGGGAGLGGALLQQISRDTGIPITELSKQFAPAKVSKRTGEVTGGALAGAKGIEALNKAILELGQNRGFAMIQAKMEGWAGLVYRFGEHWEDFMSKIGEAFEEFISPIADKVNAVLDSIDFNKLFKNIVDGAAQFGHLMTAVWNTIANAPVMKAVTQMWENLWKSLTGGIDLYGPAEKTWADKQHSRIIMARHLTTQGREWLQTISTNIENFIQNIINAFKWFQDHGDEIKLSIEAISGAFLLIKAAEIVANITQAANAIIGLGKTILGLSVVADDAVAAIGVSKEAGLLKAIGGIGAVATLTVIAIDDALGKARAHLIDESVQETRAATLTPAKISEADRLRAAHEEDWKLGPTHHEHQHAVEKAIEQEHKHAAELEKANKTQDAVNHSLDSVNKSLQMLDQMSQKAAKNDLYHLALATEQATQGLLQMNQTLAGFGAGFGGIGGMAGGFGLGTGGGGGVSGAHFTEYGPAVAGDQPGQSTYDWNSYHHVGAWPGITGPLRAGDVALGHGAQAKYHVSPGQMFTDEYGRTWRFADRSGSQDPYNVDVFHGALGGIFRKPTQALIGESGPEAVLPLHGAGAALGGLAGGPATINVNVAGHAEDPEAIARAVERVLREHYRRSAVV